MGHGVPARWRAARERAPWTAARHPQRTGAARDPRACRRCGWSRTAACSISPSILALRRTAGSISPSAKPVHGAGLVEHADHPRHAAAATHWSISSHHLPPAPALYWTNNSHFGARLLFDREGYLFFSIGDRGHMTDAQDLASPYGKLHRVHDDGRAPSDNPFVGRTDAVAEHLELRSPQPAGPGHRSSRWRTVGHRTWSPRRRRAEPRP